MGGYCVRPLLVSAFTSIRFSDSILNDFLKFYIFFVIGTYCLEYLFNKIEAINKAVILIATGAVLVLGNIASFNNTKIDTLIFGFLIALIGSAFVISAGKLIKRQHWLAYCGKHTLPIYVLQGFVIAASRLVITHIGFNDSLGVVPMLICTVAGVSIPLIVYWVTTKIWKLDGLFYPGKYIGY